MHAQRVLENLCICKNITRTLYQLLHAFSCSSDNSCSCKNVVKLRNARQGMCHSVNGIKIFVEN
jgi:hypothetical protein